MIDFETWLLRPPTETRMAVTDIFKPFESWNFGDRIVRRLDGRVCIYCESYYEEMIQWLMRQMPHRSEANIRSIVQRRMPDLWLWGGVGELTHPSPACNTAPNSAHEQ